MELTIKRLQKAAREYNEVIELSTPLDLESETLDKDMYDVLQFIEPQDHFTPYANAVFSELRFRHDPQPKPKVKSEKKSAPKPKAEKKSVEVGATVELDPDNDSISKTKSNMKKDKGIGMEDAARLVLTRTTTKDEILSLLESDLFDKKTKARLEKVTNFLSLKKQIREALDQEVVEMVNAELKAAQPKMKAKPAAKPAAKKDSPLVAEIKEAISVKQLKKIAKTNDFNWKKLKGMEFEEMQKAMLSGGKPKAKKAKAVPKVKMVPNPLIAEINGFKKSKKLAKWVQENMEEHYVKKMRKMDIHLLKAQLIDLIPAEIEKKSGEKRVVRNSIDQEARRNRIIGLVDEGTYTRKELHAILKEEFPEEGTAHSNSNILSEMKSTRPYKDGQRWERFGVGRLVVEDENGCYIWADSAKKSKKSKKNKKSNKKSKK